MEIKVVGISNTMSRKRPHPGMKPMSSHEPPTISRNLRPPETKAQTSMAALAHHLGSLLPTHIFPKPLMMKNGA